MRNITFIGTLNSTFAKWFRRIDKEAHQEKVNITRDIAKNNRVISPDIQKRLDHRRFWDKDFTQHWDSFEKLHRRNNIPGFNGKKPDTIYYVDQENRQDRIRELSKKTKENPANRQLPSDRPVSKSAVKTPSTSTKSSNSSAPKINSKSATPLLSSKVDSLQPKKLPLRKIGLGAVGLATVGALGYGLLRKSRNDKGKKRGAYSK